MQKQERYILLLLILSFVVVSGTTLYFFSKRKNIAKKVVPDWSQRLRMGRLMIRDGNELMNASKLKDKKQSNYLIGGAREEFTNAEKTLLKLRIEVLTAGYEEYEPEIEEIDKLLERARESIEKSYEN